MDALLTFTGFHDPYFNGLIDQEEQPGPILSLLSTRSFGHIFLFGTPGTQRITEETKDAISKLHRDTEVHVREISLSDPTDYLEIEPGHKGCVAAREGILCKISSFSPGDATLRGNIPGGNGGRLRERVPRPSGWGGGRPSSVPAAQVVTYKVATLRRRTKGRPPCAPNAAHAPFVTGLEILRGLRANIRGIIQEHSSTRFFVSVASGTPHMHACWVLLTASGEIPARILHVRPPRFVTKERPLVNEVDLSSWDFPTVRFQDRPITVEANELDIDAVRVQLGIVGNHPAMKRSLEMGAMLAPSQAPILILGETGTGKELFARYIHRLSGRPREVFVPVNCAAIPEDLVESLLFGHRKGAFTGALNDQVGKFDAADKGTLFLDELGDLPLQAQAKLLRVLQDGLVEPIGQAQAHRVDVRIVAATNRDLRKLVRQGKFREDLFYRLNVGEIKLPPLRERRSDIPKLALHILDRLNGSLRRPKRLSAEALSRLQSHNWAGNVRDLENVIERSVRLCRRDVLNADDLLITEPVARPDPLDALPEPEPGFSMDNFLSGARKQLILRALDIAHGNQSEASRLLDLTPQAVNKFLRQDSGYSQSCND